MVRLKNSVYLLRYLNFKKWWDWDSEFVTDRLSSRRNLTHFYDGSYVNRELIVFVICVHFYDRIYYPQIVGGFVAVVVPSRSYNAPPPPSSCRWGLETVKMLHSNDANLSNSTSLHSKYLKRRSGRWASTSSYFLRRRGYRRIIFLLPCHMFRRRWRRCCNTLPLYPFVVVVVSVLILEVAQPENPLP